jgi:hypothetical protein
MVIPRIGGIAAADVAGETAELDEADAFFDEASGEQGLAGVTSGERIR